MKKEIVVFGGTNVDLAGVSYSPLVRGDSNIGKVSFSEGGVGHNIALNLSKMGERVRFVTALGSDVFGREIKEHLEKEMDISSSLFLEGRSDVYLYVSDSNGEMNIAVNDMENIKKIDSAFIESRENAIKSSSAIIVEANLGAEAIEKIARLSSSLVYADAVSTLKVERFLPSLENIDYLKLNELELAALSKEDIHSDASLEKAMDKIFSMGLKGSILLTLGQKGALCKSKNGVIYSPAKKMDIINSTGAGDSFLSGFAFGMINYNDEKEAVKSALSASEITIMSEETVSSKMSRDELIRKSKEIEVYDKIPRLFWRS